MSARIYLHPRSNESLLLMCMKFNALGYWLVSTRSGFTEARPMRTNTNVVNLKAKQ